ncbi:SAM-dependent methyltransferase [Nonomuraea jiangxiensis]|uniref:S-adenosyl methyltransferase n=1 Tax=Nonomuraea jiangxiensis TaxID=633440 RepID=A0A1G9VXW6_9ACTN|nr:SAM-dependent methyltransferase [Nonomuraea jiangxiensis]SDM77094.1 S-adenosyl methyltransferase [Nonomuraea jiangxiensis]
MAEASQREFKPDVAHNARVWNYWLGGKDNFPADREVGDQVRDMFPSIVDVARADREFLGRAVHHLAGEAGMWQFLDIGTGLPTAENTHQVAQRVNPRARIVYVDNDPLVLVHARALLTGTKEGVTEYIDADLHDPDTILREAERTLDFSQPVVLMLLGVVNFIQDTGEARRIVKRLLEALPSGSHLALTHPTMDIGGGSNAKALEFYNAHATPQIVMRGKDVLMSFFDGLELLEPGLTSCSLWRAEESPFGPPEPVAQYGVVARKP